jgi:hypothetical protein
MRSAYEAISLVVTMFTRRVGSLIVFQRVAL